MQYVSHSTKCAPAHLRSGQACLCRAVYLARGLSQGVMSLHVIQFMYFFMYVHLHVSLSVHSFSRNSP